MKPQDYRREVDQELADSGSHEASLTAPDAADWSELLRTLGDQTQDPQARRSALETLQAGAVLGSHFNAVRADFVEALRQAAVDADQDLRRSALDALANMKDPFAQAKLREGLTGQSEALVPPAVALGMLARDDHASASSLARNVLETSKDVFARAQAVRILGADPAASGLLQQILADKDEFREVRRASAVALHGLDRDAFVREGIRILADPADFNDIRESIKGALQRDGISPAAKPPTAPARRPLDWILDAVGHLLGRKARS